MYIDDKDIQKITGAGTNYRLAQRYKNMDIIEQMEIVPIVDGLCYRVSAITYYNGYKNKSVIDLSGDNEVLSYDCDCPYCHDGIGCAHIGMILFKLQDIQIQELPYIYSKHEEVIDMDADIEAFRQQEELRREEARRLRNERMRLWEEEQERERKEQERQMLLSYIHKTKHLVNEEKAKLFRPQVHKEQDVQLYMHMDKAYVEFGDVVASLEFRIGKEKKYVLKNIEDFIENIEKEAHMNYGKQLAFTHTMDAFDEPSQKMIKFIQSVHAYNQFRYYGNSRRYMSVTDHKLEALFSLCEELPSQYHDVTRVEKHEKLELTVSTNAEFHDIYCADYEELEQMYISEHALYGVDDEGRLCKYTFDDKGKTLRLLQTMMDQEGHLPLGKGDEEAFYKYVYYDIRDEVNLTGDPLWEHSEVLEEERICLYGDIDEQGDIIFHGECYMQEQKRTLFDAQVEHKPIHMERVEEYLRSYSSYIDETTHVLHMDEQKEATYTFLQDGLDDLMQYCELYVSDALRKINKVHHVSVHAGVRLSNGLLQIDFTSKDIQKDELFDVLKSYRRKKKYHRLKNGKLVFLDSVELEELDAMTKGLQLQAKDMETGSVQVPAYRSIYLETMKEKHGQMQVEKDKNYHQLMENLRTLDVQKYKIPAHYETILRDYQIFGVKWMQLLADYQFGAILADDMGLGKTLQVIALLESSACHTPSMVVTPSSLLLNWQDEIVKFTANLRCLCIYGSVAKRNEAIALVNEFDVVITSYDYLRRDIEKYEAIQFHYIVLDEAQYIKNQKTQNAQAVKRLKGNHRLALSGTPIENSLAELWSIFDFLMPNYLYNYHYFSEHFERPIVKEQDEKAQQKLKQLVEPFILRRNKKDVLQELPDKIEQTLSIQFSEWEEKLYLANLMQVSKTLQEQLKVEKPDRMLVLAMLTRLRQICCEPRLLYENVEVPSSKLQACLELIHNLQENHQKVLIFSSFTSVLSLLEDALREQHISYLCLTGKHSKDERRNMVQQFQDGQADVFLISLKAGGTGLNLTEAQAVIHFDPWWNVSVQNQATDRAYRIGQTKNVQVFKLIMKDSIEEKIQKLQAKKQDLSDTFVEGNDGAITKMKMEDIAALFE